jgi:glycosyltransferase involved in cell wall biosynthesis
MEVTKNMKALFLYYGPHYCHAAFAKAIAAEFFPAGFGTLNIIGKAARGISMVLKIPKKQKIYLCESTFVPVTILKDLHIINKDSLIINICADPLLYYLYSNNIKGLKKEIIMSLLRDVNGFMCVGNMERELLKDTIGDAPATVVYPFVRESCFESIYPINPSLEKPNILFIGDGTDFHYKGADLLIGGFLKAKKEIPELQLNIIGKNWHPRKEWLKEGVTFVGYVPSLVQYIENASLYVHAGRGDAFPVSTIEAMLGGVPTIVSKWTGTKEIVKNVDESMVSDINVDDVANKIVNYFSLSDTQKKKLSVVAKREAAEFNEANKVGQFKENFAQLVSALQGVKK